jgi:O-acetyl-ADP-ribose deacetylase (regulator of RNase III)
MAIRTVVVPGMGTGVGGVEPQRCAVQMKLALEHVLAPARIPSFDRIHKLHAALRSA